MLINNVYKLFHSFFLVHNNNSWYLLSTYYIQTFVLSILHFDFIYFSKICNKTTNTTPFCRWKHWSMKIFSNVPKLGNSDSWSETEPVFKQILMIWHQSPVWLYAGSFSVYTLTCYIYLHNSVLRSFQLVMCLQSC